MSYGRPYAVLEHLNYFKWEMESDVQTIEGSIMIIIIIIIIAIIIIVMSGMAVC